MATLDTVIEVVLVVVFLYFLYRWLHEPIDALVGLIKRGFGNVKNNQTGGGGGTTSVIKYD